MPGANTINFNIPGSGPHVINVDEVETDDRAFTISDTSGPTIINGYSQPGSSPNTSATVSNAVIKIHIKGPRVANPNVRNYRSIDGFRVFSAGNEFRGLAFTHLRRSIWISGSNAHHNIVAGTFIGTDPAGQPWYDAITALEPWADDGGAFGIWITDGAHHNRIGGTVPADRSIISGNANDGGGGTGEGTDYNQFIGLLIGLSPDGTRRVQNGSDGLDLNFGMSYTQVGGTAPGERNIISGNPGDGVEISHDPSTEYNTVAGNYFGTAPDGNTVVNGLHFNAGYSVTIEDSPANNIIGPGNVMVNSFNGGVHMYGSEGFNNQVFGNRIGITLNGTATAQVSNRGEGVRLRFGASNHTIGPDNIITNSTEAGVLVIDDASRFNTITQNSIYNNGIGIDLGGDKVAGGDGVTLNDGAWGNGPNQFIDYPVITSATTTTVSGTALPGYRIEVFIADSAPGQHGEGRTFVGSGIANGSGQFTVPVSGVPSGSAVTATSTDSAGNTSEFSVNVAVTGGTSNTPPTVGINSPANGATIDGSLTISVNASDIQDAAGTLDVEVRIDGGTWQPAIWNGVVGRYQYLWDTTTVANGSHTIEARATDSQDAVATAGPINVSVDNEVVPNYTLPALIQAEDYNQGGEGVGYHDTTAGNSGNRYRTDDVDIETCTDPANPSGQTCYNVGWTAAGEWLAYSVRVPSAGNYTFALRVATPSSGRTVQLQIDGANLGATIAVPDTDGYQAWTTVSVVRALPAGDHELRLLINGTNININSLEIMAAAANTPPSVTIATPADGATVSGTTTIGVTASDAQDVVGTLGVEIRIDGGSWQLAAWNAGANRYQYDWNTTTVANGSHTIEARATDSNNASDTDGPITVNVNNEVVPDFVLPTTIQAEDYNAYNDTTAGNTGGRYRFDDVDIETCSDPTTPGGTTCYNIGWTAAGEWLAYDVRVPTAGSYTFALRVATPSNGRTVQIQLDGSNLGAPVAVPNSGGYQAWSTVTVVRSLPAGDHELRLVLSSTNLNLNYLTVTSGGSSNTAPSATIATPSNGTTVSGTTTIGVAASDAQDAAGTLNVQVRIDGGTWQAAIWHAGTGRYQYSWNTTTVANGNHTIEARAVDSASATGTSSQISVTVNNVSGTAVALPATIQVEDYSNFHDSDAGNTGGAYRNDDVDIAACADGSPCHYIGWTIRR